MDVDVIVAVAVDAPVILAVHVNGNAHVDVIENVQRSIDEPTPVQRKPG